MYNLFNRLNNKHFFILLDNSKILGMRIIFNNRIFCHSSYFAIVTSSIFISHNIKWRDKVGYVNTSVSDIGSSYCIFTTDLSVGKLDLSLACPTRAKNTSYPRTIILHSPFSFSSYKFCTLYLETKILIISDIKINMSTSVKKKTFINLMKICEDFVLYESIVGLGLKKIIKRFMTCYSWVFLI